MMVVHSSPKETAGDSFTLSDSTPRGNPKRPLARPLVESQGVTRQ